MENNHERHAVSEDNKMKQEMAKPYKKMIAMVVLSFIAMYILMYSMVDKLANVIPNANQIYMPGLMSMSMVVIELLVMRSMYKDRSLNNLVFSSAVLRGIPFFFGIRLQAFVSDKQFLKSMIPHYAAAILMVKEASVSDLEVRQLGEDIITSQQKEIDFIKAKIITLENK